MVGSRWATVNLKRSWLTIDDRATAISRTETWDTNGNTSGRCRAQSGRLPRSSGYWAGAPRLAEISSIAACSGALTAIPSSRCAFATFSASISTNRR